MGVYMNNYTMKNLPDNERPYEKCIALGPGSLSDAELLAVILKSGTKNMTVVELARQLLTSPNGDYGLATLYKHNLASLTSIKGVGKIKAVTLLCLLEISLRISKTEKNTKVAFNSPYVVAQYFMEELRHLEKERVIIVFLDSKNRMITHCVSTMGTINSSLFSAREILVDALKNNATGIIIVHNHPSGDPTPSSEDKVATFKLKEAAGIIGMDMLDHIIIGDKRFYSFKEENLL